MLLFLSALKLIAEIALLALLGQAVLFVLAGAKRGTNFFYQTLAAVTKPVTALVRKVTPAQVADRHVPLIAFFLLLIVWVVTTIEKISLCVDTNMVGCR